MQEVDVELQVRFWSLVTRYWMDPYTSWLSVQDTESLATPLHIRTDMLTEDGAGGPV